MKKLFFSCFLGLVLLILGPLSCRAAIDEDQLAGASAVLRQPWDRSVEVDYRKIRLFNFLKEKGSPLTPFVADFVAAADLWQIDWRLLPAIAGLESYFGRRMIPGTYNAYGWAGGHLKFNGWRDSIYYLSYKLKKNYYDRGLVNPELIGKVYAPPNPNWGKLVASIMAQI